MSNRIITHAQAQQLGLYGAKMNFETETPATPPVVDTPITDNFLSFVEAQENITSGAAATLYTKLINAMSGQIVNHLRWHVILRRAGKLDNSSFFDKLDVDTRNEQDENSRGQELKDYLTDISGHATRMPHLKAAGILNGMRYTLYDRLAAFADVPDPDLILVSMPKGVSPKELRAFPMGIELSLRGLVERIGVPSEAQLQQAETKAKVFNRSTDHARKASEEEAKRQQQQLMGQYLDIMAEAESLPKDSDEDDWTSLDLMEREIIISRVKANLNRAAENAFTRVAAARPGTDWERLQEDNLKDAEHAESIVNAFIEAHPFTMIESASSAKAAVTKLGGAYKPKSGEGVESMADDKPF